MSRRPLFPQLFLFLVDNAIPSRHSLQCLGWKHQPPLYHPPVVNHSHQSTVPVTEQQSQSPVNSFDHRSSATSHWSSATASVVSHIQVTGHQLQPASSATFTGHQLQSPVIASSRPSSHRLSSYSSSQPSGHWPSSNHSSETDSTIQSDMAAVYSPVPVHVSRRSLILSLFLPLLQSKAVLRLLSRCPASDLSLREASLCPCLGGPVAAFSI